VRKRDNKKTPASKKAVDLCSLKQLPGPVVVMLYLNEVPISNLSLLIIGQFVFRGRREANTVPHEIDQL